RPRNPTSLGPPRRPRGAATPGTTPPPASERGPTRKERRPAMTKCEGRSRTIAAACLVAVSAIATGARAQSEDQAAARVLFDEGRRLLKAGQYADACPKLEAAKQLHISAGILLNLADCYEKLGRTASAWTQFGEAAAVAKRTNRGEDAQEARRRQAVLE